MTNAKWSMINVERSTLQRLAFAGVLLSLVYRWWAHSLMGQLAEPVLVYPYVDLTYWGLHLMNVPQWISGHYVVAVLFDALLFGAALGSFIFTRKRIFPIVFTLLYLIYFVS